MSDKKTSSGTPLTGKPPPDDGAFDQEFEKFLGEETARVGAIYRKLPQAEPDAQLDARVRSLARGALRETSAPALATPGASTPAISTPGVSTPARRRRRWIPAFASAAVLVLAAGIAWRMGPQNNWTQKDATSRVAVDATATSNAAATASGASSPSVVTATPQTASAADTGNYPAATKSMDAASANRADATNAPVPFPAAKPTAAAISGGAPASAPQAELRKMETARAAEVSAATSRPAGPPKPVRDKNAAASVDVVDARKRDEGATEQPRQGAAESSDRSASAAAKARSVLPPPAAAAAPPPPPPMQAPAPLTGFAAEPPAADPPTSRPSDSTAGRIGEEAQKQAYADRFALPPGSPQANIPGRPTAAQLAAWPAPNCRAAGTVIASGPNINTRTWNYPPDVPDSAHLRLVIVKEYLDLDSREGALKAYADFRHCYPDDRWPESLLQRLGMQ